MNLSNISLNLYSFGYYAGLIEDSKRTREILGIDELVELVKKHGLGGIEIPLDYYYSVDKIEQGIEKIEKILSNNLSVFIDLEKTNVEYITRLVPYLPSLGITAVRIKMDQIGKTIYGGNRYISDTFNQAVNEFKKQLSSLLPILEKYGVSLAIENHQDFHSYELLDISKSISEELIGVTWDVGNSISVAETPKTFYNIAGNIIKNVHLKDYKVYKSKTGIRLVRCPLGEGYVDYLDVLKKLDVNNSIKNMSIELGAQSTRQCDIYNRQYWDDFSDIPIDKDSYMDFINKNAIDYDNSFSKFELGMTEEGMIKSELQDIEKSVNNLTRLLKDI